MTNSTITGTGTGPNTASLYIYGEFGFSDSGLAPVGEGDDIVALRYVDLESDYSDVAIDTGSGDDALYVLNSSFGQLVATVGDGNDVVRFDSNTFLASSLDGGPGYDLLSAHDNIGVLTYANFEKVSGTP